MKLVFVGDVMLGDSATAVGFGFHSRYPRREAAAPLAALRSLFAGAEVRFGNLECVLSGEGTGDSRLIRDQMRGDAEYAAVLSEVGFNIMSVANNHAMQHGLQGFHETVRRLEASGISVVGLRGTDGWACAPVQLTLQEQRFGMLSYCLRPRQYSTETPPFAEGGVDAICSDVRRLRQRSDVVAVSLHWGDEFVDVPSSSDVAAARAIGDAGATVIVGHHPHVTRPVEIRGDHVVAYSLGNAVSDMLWMNSLREGFALTVVAAKTPSVAVRRLWTDPEYRVQVVTTGPADHGPVDGVAAPEYAALVRRGLAAQRAALYRYTFKNLHRLPMAVAFQLILTTVRNKLASLLRP